jgi:hypothetical protein
MTEGKFHFPVEDGVNSSSSGGLFSPTYPSSVGSSTLSVFIPLVGNAEFNVWKLINSNGADIVRSLECLNENGIFPDYQSKRFSVPMEKQSIAVGYPAIFNSNVVLTGPTGCQVGLHLTFLSPTFLAAAAAMECSSSPPDQYSIKRGTGPFFWNDIKSDQPMLPMKVTFPYLSRFLQSIPVDFAIRQISDPRHNHFLK